MLNTLQKTVGEVTLRVLSHTFAFNQIAGWEHAREGCAIALAVVARFWASVTVRMIFVVDKVALGALSLSLAVCHFTASLYSVLPVASAVSWLQYQGIWCYHNLKLKRNNRFCFYDVDNTQVYFSHKLALLHLAWYSYQPSVQCAFIC
jgi:hypothetical protein